MRAIHLQDGQVVKVEAWDSRTEPRPGRTVEQAPADDPRIVAFQAARDAERAEAEAAETARIAALRQRRDDLAAIRATLADWANATAADKWRAVGLFIRHHLREDA